jgi:hypothetical protein
MTTHSGIASPSLPVILKGRSDQRISVGVNSAKSFMPLRIGSAKQSLRKEMRI